MAARAASEHARQRVASGPPSPAAATESERQAVLHLASVRVHRFGGLCRSDCREDATFTFDTLGTAFDPCLGVYTGPQVDSLLEAGFNNDLSLWNHQSRCSFWATNGTTYHIQVGGFQGAAGDVTLNWS